MRSAFGSALIVLLAGCVSVDKTPASQPRALGLGVVQPVCVLLCFGTNNQADTEGSKVGTGTVSNSQSQNSTMSPSGSASILGPAEGRVREHAAHD